MAGRLCVKGAGRRWWIKTANALRLIVQSMEVKLKGLSVTAQIALSPPRASRSHRTKNGVGIQKSVQG
jgi:hypothetical protein